MSHTELRDEEKSRCSIGDDFCVFFIIASKVTNQQVVEDAHKAHQEQEAEDALSKQVAWSATKTFKRVKTTLLNTHIKHAPTKHFIRMQPVVYLLFLTLSER